MALRISTCAWEYLRIPPGSTQIRRYNIPIMITFACTGSLASDVRGHTGGKIVMVLAPPARVKPVAR